MPKTGTQWRKINNNNNNNNLSKFQNAITPTKTSTKRTQNGSKQPSVRHRDENKRKAKLNMKQVTSSARTQNKQSSRKKRRED
ncbi:hypothetical protein E4U12_004842 [Claviceps purpurea]|nr:hypothetical protein E4U12_004842 [Claviceps purpurea]